MSVEIFLHSFAKMDYAAIPVSEIVRITVWHALSCRESGSRVLPVYQQQCCIAGKARHVEQQEGIGQADNEN